MKERHSIKLNLRTQLCLSNFASVATRAGDREVFAVRPSSSMPSHIPSQLKLDPPVFEEDIGDLSPYLALPSTSSRASSVTISSTSSPGFTTDDELDHPSNSTPKKQSFGFHLSPSSSSYSLATSDSRFQGPLPVQKEDSSQRPLRKEIDVLEVDPISVAKVRRWILGIAVGQSARLLDCHW